MTTEISIIGVYPVQADEPVHLIELDMKNVTLPIDCSEIVQEELNQPRSNWQVAYDEKILDETGTKIIGDPSLGLNMELWQGDIRLVFFFHYLDLGKPLQTPLGEVPLPAESEKPERLSQIIYQLP